MFGSPKPPTPPPPPPAAPSLASASILEQGAAQDRMAKEAEGKGFDGTLVTGGAGVSAPTTTKTLLGG